MKTIGQKLVIVILLFQAQAEAQNQANDFWPQLDTITILEVPIVMELVELKPNQRREFEQLLAELKKVEEPNSFEAADRLSKDFEKCLSEKQLQRIEMLRHILRASHFDVGQINWLKKAHLAEELNFDERQLELLELKFRQWVVLTQAVLVEMRIEELSSTQIFSKLIRINETWDDTLYFEMDDKFSKLQRKRISEIKIQRKFGLSGAAIFLERRYRDLLKIDPAQLSKIEEILRNNPSTGRNKFAADSKAMEEIKSILTEQQLKAWQDALGAPFGPQK
ncbi:hypothetical protein OAG68_01680 [bacterium]|nr:hypothetical protein [bacterium]